jgi:hypothetical protein
MGVGSTASLKPDLAVAAVVALLGASTLLHNPLSGNGLYTDIIGFFWYDFAEKGLTPYLDRGADGRHFEYPFLAGAVSILAWKIGGSLAGFYTVYSAIVILFGAVMAYAALRLSGSQNHTLIYLMAPSLLVYGIYGYDVIHAALTALSVLAFSRGRYVLSAVLLALGFQTKLLSILFLPYALLKLRNKERTLYALAFAVTAFTPILAMPEAFMEVWKEQVNWSLENAWYVHVFPDAAAPVGPNESAGRAAATLFGSLGMLSLYLYVLRTGLKPEHFMLLATSVYLLFTPRYSPQTSIMLLPFLPAAGVLLPTYPIWEVANAAILLTWFTTQSPHLPWSLPQTMSLLRFAALAVIFAQSLHAVGLLKLEEKKQQWTVAGAINTFRRWFLRERV